MKKALQVTGFNAIGSIVAILFVSSCATGYITSSINTGIGLDVSENPQTQVPHVKFGYIRSGLYYIPTGKVSNPDGLAADTPHVVSKIHVSSEFLKNIEITEKFAVGDAVSTAAAHQLFLDTSSETMHSTSGGSVQPPVVGPDTTSLPHRQPVADVPGGNQTPPVRPGTQTTRSLRRDIVRMLDVLGKPKAADDIVNIHPLTPENGDPATVTVCKAILKKAATLTPPVTGATPSTDGILAYQRNASPEELVSLKSAMQEFIK